MLQMGVGTLILVNAAKVEKDYWGSHLVRGDSFEAIEELLLEGLAQARNSNFK